MITNFVPQIRVFLASPGDVNEERAVALQVLDMLEYDPLFRKGGAGGISLHAIAWDKPGGDVPMRITKTPQTAITEGLPRPSECDIVLVLFWGRMGTPLPYPEYQKDEGSPYLSGTEWEFRDAFDAERTTGKPVTLVYRRTEEPRIDLKDRKAFEQYHLVLDFFEQFRHPDTGALLGGFNEYTNPEDFRQKLINHLRYELDKLLTGIHVPERKITRELVEAPPLWSGSPFPGLRAFTRADAPIFFGRGQETGDLVQRIGESRFVAVVAASGSGKSSLVAAGVIPRLEANAIVSGDTGSKDWRFVRFTPGEGITPEKTESPLAPMFKALCAVFPEHVVSPFMVVQEKEAFINSVSTNPSALIDICDALLAEANAPAWAEILFFIDQFEELFTLVRESDRPALIALLEVIARSKRLRCVVTMRSDFMATAIEYPALAALINGGNYVLAPPTAGALVEMIKRPAERAGLTWEDGLPERIQTETGSGSGALAVMAYALDELYHASGEDKRLTAAAYEVIGGVEGAIGKRAEDTFDVLELPDKETVLKRVFRELVTVDERGTPTRQRATSHQFDRDALALIKAFIRARLLVTDNNTVEVAHEALFRSWTRLKDWIAEAQEDLILLRQVRNAAHDWQTKHRPDFLLWPQERLTLVYAMQARLNPDLNEVEQAFIEPEQERLYREIAILTTDDERRRDIGDRLAVIGDTRHGVGVKDGIPDIAWLPVEGSNGKYKFKFGHFEIKPFFIAKYQVTYAQYQAFIKAEDGYHNTTWWQDFPDKYRPQSLDNQRTKIANAPRDTISWYQSVAFARWLDAKYREHGLFEVLLPEGEGLRTRASDWQVRLPTEWEWQWAAQNGTEARAYPWGEWQEGYANTNEAGLSRTTTVGMYPHGTAQCGALDMAGNLWEWCLNDYKSPDIITGFGNEKSKVLRGGSFDHPLNHAAASVRYYNLPYYDRLNYGLRLVLSAPIASLVSGTLTSESE